MRVRVLKSQKKGVPGKELRFFPISPPAPVLRCTPARAPSPGWARPRGLALPAATGRGRQGPAPGAASVDSLPQHFSRLPQGGSARRRAARRE